METKDRDHFTQKLKAQKELLQACQTEKGVESCLKCEKLFGCDTRALYVKTVYESMSKGETGGFEF